jgi:DNA modification methylase
MVRFAFIGSSIMSIRAIQKVVRAFWTAKQRQGSSIHEVPYRACFKPQLPRYFIHRFTKQGDAVYDPFSGRGTTTLEAALMGRRVVANDIDPLSRILTEPRLCPPDIAAVEQRLKEIPYKYGLRAEMDLSMFFHPDTQSQIVSLRNYLQHRKATGTEDYIDRWIRIVATTRLTGHSSGYFSAYTLPPNQAVSAESQRRINRKRKQQPEYRDTKKLILRKTKSLLRSLSPAELDNLRCAAANAILLTCDASQTHSIIANSVQLTVTSPPFLDIVQYAKDNWLRWWLNTIDAENTTRWITMARTVEAWKDVMSGVFRELYRITRNGGYVAFEVGEVRKGKVRLEEHVIALGIAAGFVVEAVLINVQRFTKTAHIWGVSNNKHGTNTNRIVLFKKSDGPNLR